jgi:hypothetical protein
MKDAVDEEVEEVAKEKEEAAIEEEEAPILLVVDEQVEDAADEGAVDEDTALQVAAGGAVEGASVGSSRAPRHTAYIRGVFWQRHASDTK